MAKRKLLYIEWNDAKSEGDKGWKSLSDLKTTPMLCFSIGWVIHESDLAVTIASSLIFDQDDYDGDLTIPKSWIVNSREIKCARFRPKAEQKNQMKKDSNVAPKA